jgi:hypothetical protein
VTFSWLDQLSSCAQVLQLAFRVDISSSRDNF